MTAANGLASRPFAQSLKTAWWSWSMDRQWRRYRIEQAAERVYREMHGVS